MEMVANLKELFLCELDKGKDTVPGVANGVRKEFRLS
jgi:hypothetical protein